MMSIRSPLLFVRGVARVKSIMMIRDVNQESFTFCTQRCAYKKYKRWLGTSIRSLWLMFARWFTDHACDQK
jgi:hypothetical protein